MNTAGYRICKIAWIMHFIIMGPLVGSGVGRTPYFFKRLLRADWEMPSISAAMV